MGIPSHEVPHKARLLSQNNTGRMACAMRRPRLPAPKTTTGAESFIIVRNAAERRQLCCRPSESNITHKLLCSSEPVVGDCIANPFPALLCIAAQEQIVFGCKRVDQM